MAKVIAYVRVSTEEQATEGVSLEAQEAALRAYCTMRGLELVDVVVDAGVSGGKPLSAREGGARVLEAVKARRVSAVVALKLDRLFRDASDCLGVTSSWDKAGVALHLVDMGGQAIDTSTAMGRFFLTVMAGAAEMERNLVRERTKAAMRHKQAKGEFTGGPTPFGFRLAADGVRLEADAAEQRVLQLIDDLKGQGMSVRAIARALDLDGTPSRGSRWHPTTVARLLKRAA
jgi:site-specific DNA recombinase